MSRSTIRQWLQHWFQTRLHSRRPVRSLLRRLFLEPLEDRWVPAMVTWLNPVSGDWDTAANWSNNAVPTAADDASITFAGILVTHNTNANDAVHSVTSAASMSLAAGSLSITTNGTFNDAFTLSGGTLNNSGTINMNGSLTWSGGTLSGAGMTTLNGAGQTFLSGSDTLDTGTLNNFSVVSDNATITLVNGATINSNTAWTLNLSTNAPAFVGSGTFNNLDQFIQAGPANNAVNVPFNNSSFLDVQGGTLSLNGGGTDTGSDDVEAGATLQFGGGTYALTTSSSVFDAGNVAFSGGETDISGGFTPTGAISILGSSTVNFTFNVNGTGQVTFTTLDMSGGLLMGPSTVTVTGATTWTGGAMTDFGVTELDGSVSLSNTGVLLDTRTLNTTGTVTDNNADITMSDFATINNNGGTWNLSGTFNNLTLLSGDGTFNNFGTMTSNSGVNLDISAALNNNGLFHVQTGSLTLTSFGTDTGTFTADSGATLVLSNSFGSTFFLQGTVVNGAGTFDVESSFLEVEGSSTIATTSFIFNNSDIDNNDTLTFAPATQAAWTGFSDIFGSGVTLLEGATTISGNSDFQQGTLNNFGQVTQNAAVLTLFSNGIVNNESGATWALQNGSSITNSGAFNNLGSLLSSSTTSQNSISAATFTSSGSIDVLSGVLSLSNGGTDTGSDTVESGAILQFSGGTYNLNAGSNLTGAGGVTFNAGTVSISGGFTPTGAITINGGTANFNSTVNGSGSVTFTTLSMTTGTLTGTSTITVTGPTAWSGGTMSDAGVTNLRGGLSITGPSTLDTRTLNNFGNATQIDPTLAVGSLTLANGAVVNNESGFAWNLTSTAPNSVTLLLGNGTFNNFGTLTSSDTTNITVNVPFNNDGTVQVQSGTLTVLGDGVDTGTFNIASGATLTFSAGSDTFANATVSGAGTFVVSGAETMTVAGSVSIGSANFTLDSSTLTGSGTLTVTSATTWNSGTMSGSGVTLLEGNSTISGSNTFDTRTLNNFGTVTQNTSTLALGNGAVVNNEAASPWNLASTTDGLQLFFGNGTFNNAGTLSAGSAVNIVFAVPVNNTGNLDVQSGTLTLLAGGTSTSGTFAITGGANLNFGGGTYNIDIASFVLGAGNVSFTGGTTTVAGAFTPGGAVAILNGATAAFTNTVNNIGAVTFTTLNLSSGGVLTEAATVTVTGATTWSGGTMSGAGITNLLGSSTIAGNDTLDTRTLNNFGTATDNTTVTLTNAAVINNDSGAAWNLQNNANILGSGMFNNAGTATVAPSTATDIAVMFNNNGTVNVQGSLNLDSGGSGSGSLTVASGATLSFTGGTENLNAGSSVSGAGNVSFLGGTVNVAGNFTPTGSIVIGGSGSLATANFSSAVTLTTLRLNVGGTLTGSGSVTVSGATTWSGGTMSDTGATDLQGAATLTGVETLDTRTLNNSSTITESGTLHLLNGATLANESGGTWNLQGSASIGANGSFNNAGTLSLASNSTLAVTAYQQTAGTLSGGGTIVGDVVINGGVVSPGFSPGILTIQGNYTQNSNGSLNVEIDGTTAGSQYSVLDVSGASTLGGTLNITQTSGFAPPPDALFQIVTAGSVAGTFATVNGLRTNNGERFAVQYGSNSVVLGVVVPGIVSVTSPTPSGTYGTGAVITVTVTFNEPVTLNGGNLTIRLNDGGVVTITPFTNSLTATGTYTVATGQSANPLDTNSPLVLDGGATLQDATGSPVSLGIPAGASLANNKTLVIMTMTPVSPPPVSPPPPVSAPPVSPPPPIIPPPPPAIATVAIGVVSAGPGGTAVWTLYNDLTGSNAIATFTFGLATDIPLVGDWNGSGIDNAGVVRPTASGLFQWTLDTNGDHAYDAGDGVSSFGISSDAPVLGDWTGSGTTKIGVVRAGANDTAQWSLDSNGDGVFDSGDAVTTYGLATDKFGAGHWTGPGKDELAVVRAGAGGTAVWTLNTTGTGVFSSSDAIDTFGLATDTFIVGDWNGDGRTKIGVMRPGPDGTMVVTLDSNGDGVYDAGDQVFTIPGSVAGNIEFGRWLPVAALKIADGPANTGAPALQRDATFQADVNLAIDEWAQAGLNGARLAQLRGLTYSVGTLDGGLLGETSGNLITLDATAQGHGWSESATPQPGQIDLVTALAHEMGHALGLPDQNTQPNDLMFETLLPGVRKTPTAADVDALFTTTGTKSAS